MRVCCPKRFRYAALFLLLPALLVALPSSASADSAQGSLTSFSYRLTDLDVTDGVTPTLTYVPSLSGTPGEQSFTSLSFSQVIYSAVSGPGSRDGQSGESFANTVADIGFAGASTSATGISYFVSVANGERFDAEAAINQYFDLAPHTQVTFSAVGHAELSRTNAFRLGIVQIILSAGPIFEVPKSYTLVKLDDTGSVDKAFTASARNDGSSTARYFLLLDGNMGLFNDVAGPAPVPEPALYAEMLLGFCLTGCWFVSVRRRYLVA